MTETSTTSNTTSQRAGVVAHALRALADHIERHHLPEPGSIEIETDHLEFHIAGEDAAVWVASIGSGVDDRTEVDGVRGIRTTRVKGRLPDSGVRVAIEWLRFTITRGVVLEAVTR